MSYSRIIPSHSKKNRHSIVHCSLSHLSGFSMILYQNGTRTEPDQYQTGTRRYIDLEIITGCKNPPESIDEMKNEIFTLKYHWYSVRIIEFDLEMLSLLLSWYFLFLYDYISDLNAYFVSKMTYVYIITTKMENILILKFGRSRSRRFS